MKTIIAYATKHGAAAEVAQRIADRIGDATVCNLKQGGVPSLADFDCIIIGSSIYAGTIRKEAKAFLSKNVNVLREKKLGLFISGLEASGEKKFFDTNFPPDILRMAKAASFLGGIFDPKKAGAMERLIIKVVAKKIAYVNNIDDGKIEQFVKTMKA